jgi:hypothetical protein
MEEGELALEARTAGELIEEEDDFSIPVADPRRRADPGSVYNRLPSRIGDSDLEILKSRFPRLREFSDNFLKSRTMEELLKIESTSIKVKEAERRGDAEERLSLNKQNLETNAVWIERAKDDRWSTLHPARFLAGAACSTKKMWLSARATTDVSGHNPVANYDLTSVGMGGFVTSKGWIELANPASTKMALRLFNINNVGSRTSGSKSAKNGNDMDDIGELGEFKLALRTLRTAAQFVCPWNFSYLAIENFMIQNDFCKTELTGTENPAATLTQFVDYILHENANRWRDAEGFISTGEMKTFWLSFSSARPRVLLKKKETHSNFQSNSSGKKHGNQSKQNGLVFSKLPFHHPRLNMPFTDTCRAWNLGKCSKAAGACATPKGTQLKHVCNWSDLSNPNATVCGLNHQSYVNH